MVIAPTGYLPLREAVTSILQHTHGKFWGQQEIDLESNAVPVPGTSNNEGGPLMGQPFDRQTIATAHEQVQIARKQLSDALVAGDLTGGFEGSHSINSSYWSQPSAATSLITGILEVGNSTDPNITRWQDYPVLLNQKQFNRWLKRIPGLQDQTRGRRMDPAKDVTLEIKIRQVLATAKRLWSKDKPVHGYRQAAKLLAADRSLKDIGYSVETIRKILNGTYSTSKRLGIPGFPGIDTQ
jgi:hypothetical protein